MSTPGTTVPATGPDATRTDATRTDTGAGRAAAGTSHGGARSWRAALRRRRGTALVVSLLLLGAAALTVLTGTAGQVTTPSDPDNAGPDGARAVAQVLADHGVHVDVVRSLAELRATPAGPGTTVLVTSTADLSRSVAARALEHAAGADRVVLLSPGGDAVEGMGLPVDAAATPVWDVVRAGCRAAALTPELVISGGDHTYRPRASAVGAVSCFPDSGGAVVLTLPASPQRPAVTLLGSAEVLDNGTVLKEDDAAVALRILGASPRLLWYVADPADVPADDPTSADTLVPAWVMPGLALGASALLALMLWRGRRLGRLVTEPLPAVVSATETTRSRSRMYHRAADRTRAAAVLQAGTRARLTAYLGLPRGTDPATLAAAVAGVTGRPHAEVAAALVAAPHDDPSLLALAQLLATLEKEVHRP